jgi:hypothetical protein
MLIFVHPDKFQQTWHTAPPCHQLCTCGSLQRGARGRQAGRQFGTSRRALRCGQNNATELPARNVCTVSRNGVQGQECCCLSGQQWVCLHVEMKCRGKNVAVCQVNSGSVCTKKRVATAAVAPKPRGNFVQHTQGHRTIKSGPTTKRKQSKY